MRITERSAKHGNLNQHKLQRLANKKRLYGLLLPGIHDNAGKRAADSVDQGRGKGLRSVLVHKYGPGLPHLVFPCGLNTLIVRKQQGGKERNRK